MAMYSLNIIQNQIVDREMIMACGTKKWEGIHIEANLFIPENYFSV